MNRRTTCGRVLRGAAIAVLGVALALGAGARRAAADVTVTAKTVFDGIGARGWGAREGTSVLVVAGNRARRETTWSAAGRPGRPAGAGEKKTAIITRLDKNSVITVNYASRTYEERTFEEMKQNLGSALASMGEGGEGEEAPARKESRVTWSPMKVDAKRTGAKETINGFACEETVITGRTEGKNTETGQTCVLVLTVDVWTTPRTPAMDEVAAFHRRQAEALGMDMEQMEAIGSMLRALGSSDTEGLSAVTGETRKVAGYPIRGRFTVEKGGDCGMAGAGGPGAGPLAGMMARKRAASRAESAEGLTKIFGSTRKVVSVTTAPAPAAAFDPPSDFTRKEPSGTPGATN